MRPCCEGACACHIDTSYSTKSVHGCCLFDTEFVARCVEQSLVYPELFVCSTCPESHIRIGVFFSSNCLLMRSHGVSLASYPGLPQHLSLAVLTLGKAW